jgi:hypothetical protein
MSSILLSLIEITCKLFHFTGLLGLRPDRPQEFYSVNVTSYQTNSDDFVGSTLYVHLYKSHFAHSIPDFF